MNKILLVILSVLVIASCAACSAFAEEVAPANAEATAVAAPAATPAVEAEVKYPNVKVHTQVFTGYSYTRAASQNFNSFNLTRTDLGIHGNVAKDWSYKLTIDMAPLFGLVNQNITLSDGSSAAVALTNTGTVNVKHAFMAYNLYGHSISFGLVDTVWGNWAAENAWGHDRIAWSPLGTNGYLTNSRWDLGLSVHGKPLDGMLEYHVGVYNGGGYQQLSEISNQKNVQLRLTATPLGDWMSLSAGLQWEGITNAADQYVVPVVLTFDLTDMFDHAIYYTYMRADGQDSQMIAYVLNAYLMNHKINPFFRIDYGLQNNTVATGPALGKNDINIYTGIGYIFNKFVSIDMAFIYTRDDSSVNPDTYSFGPFAEVKF